MITVIIKETVVILTLKPLNLFSATEGTEFTELFLIHLSTYPRIYFDTLIL